MQIFSIISLSFILVLHFQPHHFEKVILKTTSLHLCFLQNCYSHCLLHNLPASWTTFILELDTEKFMFSSMELVSIYLSYLYMCQSFSCIRLFAIPWTVAQEAPLTVGFSRQEYWSGLPFPSPVVIYNKLLQILYRRKSASTYNSNVMDSVHLF